MPLVARALERRIQPTRARLLLAEDEHLLRASLAQFLEARGYAVEAASTLAECRTLLAGPEAFDAAVLDVSLPDGTTLDLLGTLPPEDVVVISAHPEPARFARAAVRHFFPKPLDLEALGRRVDLLAAVRRPAASSDAVERAS